MSNTSVRTDLSKHDLDLVKRSVKTCMSGGYRQVYLWAGDGFKEHWADHITLGIVTNREGVVSTEWVFALKLAVYQELGLEHDAPTPDHIAQPARVDNLAK